MVPPLRMLPRNTRCSVVLAVLLCAGQAAAQRELLRRTPAGEDGDPDAGEGDVPPGAPRVPWRGTALKWSQALTTTALGVGQDYQSSAYQVYAHGYWALLNYYLHASESGSVRIASSPGFDVELTNSEVTTRYREPQLRDLNLSVISVLPLYRSADGGYGFTALPNATVLFPTSELSRDSGTYVVTSPRLTVGFDGPLLRGSGFPQLFQIAASVRWDHRFSAATEPVNPEVVRRARQTPTGQPYFSDQLSGVPFAHDTVGAGGFIYLEGLVFDNPLELVASLSFSNQFLYQFDQDVCVQTLGARCDAVLGTGDAATRRVTTGFTLEAYYYPTPEIGISIGYQNLANQLAPDGRRRSPFYSPDAAFTTQLMLSLDALYEAATGLRRSVRFILPG